MRAESVWDALRDGSPGVIAAALLVTLGAALGIWLRFARRPVPPLKGHPTVDAICARVERENTRRVTFEKLALHKAIRAAKAANSLTEVIPVSEIPEPRTPQLTRPYAQGNYDRERAFGFGSTMHSPPSPSPAWTCREKP
jgi:hypothetical protein